MPIRKAYEYAAIAAVAVVLLVIGIVMISYRASKVAVTWVNGGSGTTAGQGAGALTAKGMYELTDSAGNVYKTKPLGSTITQESTTGTTISTGTISKSSTGLMITWVPATAGTGASGVWTYTPASA